MSLEWGVNSDMPRAHLHVQLPGAPTSFRLAGETLTIVTVRGTVELDRDGEMTLLPCDAT
jgi:hypothetical protein